MSERIDLPRELVLASAGAGKTYSLSSRLIALMAGREGPGAIFASTFTRKAAGEILDRVLLRLGAAVLDESQFSELRGATALAGSSGPVPMLKDRDHAAGLLLSIRDQLHRLNISTLDAFFVGVVQRFGLELGMPIGWTIAEDVEHEQLRLDAVHRLLDEAEPQELIELLRMVNRGDRTRSVHGRLMRLVGELHDIYQQIDFSQGDPFRVVEMPEAMTPPDEATVNYLVERMRQAPLPEKKAGGVDARWLSAHRQVIDALGHRRWDEVIGQTLIKNVAKGEPKFYGRPLPEPMREVYEQVIDCARIVLLRDLINESHAMSGLMHRFDRVMRTLKQRQRAYRFDDMTRVLAHGMSETPIQPAELAYRMDGRLHHLLLDEFQDTSVMQWHALRPLVDDVLQDDSGARCISVVADPKQSIYGWRGGEPELVYAVGNDYQLTDRTLAKSWRSSQIVLDAVNATFERITTTTVIDEEDRPVLRQWSKAFTPHTAARELPGYVELRVLGRAEDGETQERVGRREAARRIADLSERHPHASVGVLVRCNKAVAHLVYELRQRGVAVSEEGGNPLTDSPAVAAILALLRLADHPGDTISRYHVARCPLGEALGFTDEHNDRTAALLARNVRQQLIERGYGAVLFDWVQRVAERCDARDLSRLMQLVELGCRYEQEATIRPGGFVAMVEKTKVADPTAARVRVMTIHQSKGLEFDAVVLPDLNAKFFRGGRGPVLVRRDGVTGPIRAVFPYVTDDQRTLLRGLDGSLDEMYREQRGQVLRDALSALYVAMTRARHGLYMWVDPTPKSNSSDARNAARILAEMLAPDERGEPAAVLYQQGDPDWSGDESDTHSAASGAAKPDSHERETGESLSRAPFPRLAKCDTAMRLLPRRTPSRLEGGERIDPASLFSLHRRAATARGLVFHRWLEEIIWLDDGAPDEPRLRDLARQMEVSDKDIETHLTEWRRMLAGPNLRRLLSRPTHETGHDTDIGPCEHEVRNEKRFVVRDGSDVLEGVIDRLVITRQRGAFRALTITDYKTDQMDGEQADAAAQRLSEHYRPQMAAYCRAAARMYGLDITQVHGQLMLLAVDRLVTLEPQNGD